MSAAFVFLVALALMVGTAVAWSVWRAGEHGDTRDDIARYRAQAETLDRMAASAAASYRADAETLDSMAANLHQHGLQDTADLWRDEARQMRRIADRLERDIHGRWTR